MIDDKDIIELYNIKEYIDSAETGVMHSQRLSDMAAAFSGLDS